MNGSMNAFSPETRDLFMKRCQRPLELPAGVEPTRLHCRNFDVDGINRQKLDALPGQAKVFRAVDQPSSKSNEIDKLTLYPASLSLKIGAQVMLLKNDGAKLVNGSRGVVVGWKQEGLDVLP